jgi:hypothetical protein
MRRRSRASGAPQTFRFAGEYYWRQMVTEQKTLKIRLPLHHKEVVFDVTNLEEHSAFEGPWRFIDVARFIAKVLLEAGESLEDTLRYSLVSTL